jgi:flagellar biosynthesis anti-sigma factor FlgM
MRIPPETIRSLVGLHTQRVSRTNAVGPAAGLAGVYRSLASDAVSLSDEAALLNTLKQGVKAMPEADAVRTQQVRQELASGSFVIDPRQVAEGLVQELSGVL